jgi:hypothetical protein
MVIPQFFGTVKISLKGLLAESLPGNLILISAPSPSGDAAKPVKMIQKG